MLMESVVISINSILSKGNSRLPHWDTGMDLRMNGADEVDSL